MANIKDYADIPTEELREILRRDLDGDAELDLEKLLEISRLLALREPSRHTPEEAWTQFCEHYLPEVLNDPEDEKIPES